MELSIGGGADGEDWEGVRIRGNVELAEECGKFSVCFLWFGGSADDLEDAGGLERGAIDFGAEFKGEVCEDHHGRLLFEI